uniref:Uncharacterized protein n=1 Tax=Candidatus Kentrum sp. TUN TaxID=2126343 RepID=A0A450ZI20_9GAMM|nr:MAG: hypothetical protein BECKTUN1418F_GA0071002_102111 [Candidatus Kentron sp. TUN]VFK54657.1 MAG: hypothetical protein BECKTUN1418E_GA0071001_102211 [Candidatus Kentron sp. TUN]
MRVPKTHPLSALESANMFGTVFYIATLSICLQSLVHAQDSIGSSIDCTQVDIPYSEHANLTREERLALMDKAFFDSLDQFTLCQSARNSQGSSGASGGAGGAGNASGGGGSANGSGRESSASSEIAGTEEPKELPVAKDISGQKMDSGQMEQTAQAKPGETTSQIANGKLPDDIPSVDNDDTLAAQIRYAAEKEKDPERKAKLWNEYRKYKGLPTRN